MAVDVTPDSAAIRVERRHFLRTAGAAGFALAVQPVRAQQVVSTSSDGLVTGSSQVAASDSVQLPLYFARPQAVAKPPVVLVVQEIFGVHEHIRDICRRFAQAGHLAIAPELYCRHGDPAAVGSIQEILERIVSRVPDAQVMADLDACVEWARQAGGDIARLTATGFCWGGRITWLYAAHQPALRAGVAWYGRLSGASVALTPQHPLDVVDALKSPVLGLYGGQDQGIPTTEVERMRVAMRKSPSDAARRSDIVLYAEAQHGFHADYRRSYRRVDAMDAWQRCLDWMVKHSA
ncbi:MAG: dienelactone hydrolase family protein [Methyloversatilis sp.]|jgi:carboxymethylenebutenolidase|nr:dienelactone hydrolase family protein [Methyloversatilis sp.]MBP6192931.1 dienelactone hydrolase family protein [Methyloversatilis sp.]MBP9117062.1 dienelactone hydrolase family protein [Methyloversatilis sp.]